MESTPRFRPDLYQDTAIYYDRYRVPYPAVLIDDLVSRAGIGGSGRLLDLACGPGRLTFPLCRHFAEVVAVDQEAESVDLARRLAVERGAPHVRWLAGRAEDLELSDGFELVTMGDAFHRLDRRRVARLVTEWLQPGGHVALVWTSMPWGGSAPWQQAALEWIKHWMDVAGSLRNIPPDLAESLVQAPHTTVLVEAELELVGTYSFTAPHVWSLQTLAGLAHSTSILSRPALGGHLADFERDLAERLLAVQPDGRFEEQVTFWYDLAVKP